MKRIIYQNETGGVSIIIPSPNSKLTIEQHAEKSVPKGMEYKIVNTSDIPTDRTFRDAWERGKDGIEISMSKAREIMKDRLRAERKPLFDEQNIEFMKALQNGKATKDITDEIERLKDITKLADKAETLEQLKYITCKQ